LLSLEAQQMGFHLFQHTSEIFCRQAIILITVKIKIPSNVGNIKVNILSLSRDMCENVTEILTFSAIEEGGLLQFCTSEKSFKLIYLPQRLNESEKTVDFLL
jgi:hypothetical protein